MLRDGISSARECFFPAMKTLKIRFEVSLDDVETWPNTSERAGEMLHRINQFSNMFTNTFSDVSVDSGFLVKSDLCKPYLSAFLGDLHGDGGHVSLLVHKFHVLKDNYLVYRAQLSQPDDPVTFHGLKLEFDSAGKMGRQLLEDFAKEV